MPRVLPPGRAVNCGLSTTTASVCRFDGSTLRIEQFNGRAGQGTVTGSGTIGLAASARFPIDLRMRFENAQLARSDDLGATATGTLAIVNDAEGARISGELALGEVRYELVRQAAAEVRQLGGVRRRGEPTATCAFVEDVDGALYFQEDDSWRKQGTGPTESEWPGAVAAP